MLEKDLVPVAIHGYIYLRLHLYKIGMLGLNQSTCVHDPMWKDTSNT